MFHWKIRGDPSFSAVVCVRMFREIGFVDSLFRWIHNAIVLDECIEPIGGWTASRTEESIKAVV